MPAIVGPALLEQNGAVRHSARRFPRIRTSAIAAIIPLHRWRTTERWYRSTGYLTPAPGSGATVCDWIEGAVMLLPTATFRELQGFDERFFMYSEEVDLQRRARQLDVPSVVMGDVKVTHTGGGSMQSGQRLGWSTQGEWIYFDKWQGRGAARRFQIAWSGTVAINLVWDLLRALLGRKSHPFRYLAARLRVIRQASAR